MTNTSLRYVAFPRGQERNIIHHFIWSSGNVAGSTKNASSHHITKKALVIPRIEIATAGHPMILRAAAIVARPASHRTALNEQRFKGTLWRRIFRRLTLRTNEAVNE
jgi:hypothetical protein